MSSVFAKEFTCNGGGGCSGTTPVWIRYDGKEYEARCGFALLGNTNMSEDQLKAINYNPFHGDFRDNFATGIGATEDEALEALKKDMVGIGNSIWAV